MNDADRQRLDQLAAQYAGFYYSQALDVKWLIDQLRAETTRADEAEADFEDCADQDKRWSLQYHEHRERIAVLEDALRFYADHDNYTYGVGPASHIEINGGAIARAVLTQEPTEANQ